MSGSHVFDLRLPLGYLFLVLGALLILAGFNSAPEANAHSLGLNINLFWGVILILFGALCLWLAKRAGRRRLP